MKKCKTFREKESLKWKNNYKEEEYFPIKEDKNNFKDKNLR